MSYSIWGAIAETPWWIYLLFIWLLLLGYQATKPRRIFFRSSAIFPLILMLVMIMLLPVIIHLDQFKAGMMVLSILPGILFGYLQFHFRGIRAIKHTSQFFLPGSYGIFVVLSILLFIKFYYSNYAVALDPAFFRHEKVSLVIAMLCGFSVGIQLAKTWCFYRCMKTGPFLEG